MNFKTFLEREIGLGNIGRTVDRIFRTDQFQQQVGSIVNTDLEHPSPFGDIADPQFNPKLPQTTLNIPSMERTARIVLMMKKKNPIYIRLSDGTQLYLTYDQFKRIDGEPEIGKNMTVKFQRNPSTTGDKNSKIEKISVQ